VRERVARQDDATAVGREVAGVGGLEALEQVEEDGLRGRVAEDLVEGDRGLARASGVRPR
jgi:hypothetical protein